MGMGISGYLLYCQHKVCTSLSPALNAKQFVRLAIASVMAFTGTLKLFGLAAAWLGGFMHIGVLWEDVLPSSAIAVIVGVPAGWIMMARGWIRHGHCVTAAFFFAAIFSVGRRVWHVLVDVAADRNYPLSGLTHPGSGDALIHIPVEIAAWAIAGTVYWAIAFRHMQNQGPSSESKWLLFAAFLGWLIPLLYLVAVGYLLAIGTAADFRR